MIHHLYLGSGALLHDYAPAATSAPALRQELQSVLADPAYVIADTTGAGTFRAIPLTRNPYEAARRTPPAHATLLDGWKVTLSSAFTGVTPEALEALLPWASVERTGRIATLTAPDSAFAPRAIPRLSWVGESSLGLVWIDLTNALHTSGATLTFLPGDEGALPFEFRAHTTGAQAPFAIRLLSA